MLDLVPATSNLLDSRVEIDPHLPDRNRIGIGSFAQSLLMFFRICCLT